MPSLNKGDVVDGKHRGSSGNYEQYEHKNGNNEGQLHGHNEHNNKPQKNVNLSRFTRSTGNTKSHDEK